MTNTASSVLRKLTLLMLLLVMSVGVWRTFSGYRAGVLYERSQILQGEWSEDLEKLTTENWQSAGQDLFLALSLRENEAEYLKQYGLLLFDERKLSGNAIAAEELQRIYTNSIETQRLAIKQRPASPYLWSYFALAKAFAGQFDGEFDLALERIKILGPWEREIHLMVASLANYYWPSYSNYSRQHTTDILQRSLSNPNYANTVLESFNSSEFMTIVLCPLLDSASLTESAQQACQLI